MRSAAVFDVDGTLVEKPSLESRFVRFLWQYGEIDTREVIWNLAAVGFSFVCGNGPENALRIYLSGMRIDKVTRLARDFVEQEVKPRIFAGGIDRIHTHREEGCLIGLISGSPAFLVRPLAEFLQADFAIGTEIKTAEGRYRERISGIHPMGDGKRLLMLEEAARLGVSAENSYAYGNSFHDRFILGMVAHPIAVKPDRRLRALAESRGWAIEEFGG